VVIVPSHPHRPQAGSILDRGVVSRSTVS